MAQFPGAVRTFLTKKDRTDINYAGDVNALQDEVTQIESTLGVNPHIGLGAVTFASVAARILGIETKAAKMAYGVTDLTFNLAGEVALTHNLGQVPSTIQLTPGLLATPTGYVGLAVRSGSLTANAFVCQSHLGFGAVTTPFVGTLKVYWFVGA